MSALSAGAEFNIFWAGNAGVNENNTHNSAIPDDLEGPRDRLIGRQFRKTP